MATATPLKYHGPGWRVEDFVNRDYIVWAPNEKRDCWQSCWDDGDDEDAGDFRKGDTLAEVIAAFPAQVRAALEAVAT